jgi:hypothetical protein
MIRIAVTPRAYRAIKASLPEGSVAFSPERDGRGRYLSPERDGRGRYRLMLTENTANSLNLRRRLSETISDVIIRLARKGRLPA